MPRLKLRNDSDFPKLLSALKDELVSASISFRLYTELMDAKEGDYSVEFGQSWTFWSLTIGALADSTVYRLAKAYDHNKESLNLINFLELVQQRSDLFERDKFLERMQANPHAHSLAEQSRLPDPKILAEHLDFVRAKSNPLVKRLVTWRDKYFAHRAPEHVLKPEDIGDLRASDVETLLKRGVEIVNYYSDLYSATVDSTTIVGHDDYKRVLKWIRAAVQRHKAETDRFYEEARRAQKTRGGD